jgi:hypothetical protein
VVAALGVLTSLVAASVAPVESVAAGRLPTAAAGIERRAPESATAGPDAVTGFGSAASVVAGTTMPPLSAGIVGIAPTPDGRGYWWWRRMAGFLVLVMRVLLGRGGVCI